MPDICDLLMTDHEQLRRDFAELDDHRRSSADVLRMLWTPLADHLDRHAEAEEHVLYSRLVALGRYGTGPAAAVDADDAEDETDDAIGDHNDIRDAVRDSRSLQPGDDDWWEAVDRARSANSEHLGEEESGALALFRQGTDASERLRLGAQWQQFVAGHASPSTVDAEDKDPARYVADQR